MNDKEKLKTITDQRRVEGRVKINNVTHDPRLDIGPERDEGKYMTFGDN